MARPDGYPVHLPYNPPAREAYELCRELGLSLAAFNSGHPKNNLNGWRVFRGLDRTRYFDEDFMVHHRTPAEIIIWLHGYAAGLLDAEKATT